MSLFTAIVVRGSDCDEQPADKTPQNMLIVPHMKYCIDTRKLHSSLAVCQAMQSGTSRRLTSLKLHQPNTYDSSAVGCSYVCWFAAA